VLLAVAVVGIFVRPRRLPNFAAPVAVAVSEVVVGITTLHHALESIRPLVAPLAFVLLAVPMASLLDRLGFFESVAASLGATRHLEWSLWLLAAGVTTVFNLDAAVLLLTPLYVRLARRHGLDAIALAFVPMLLATLASSALPVSNLTNLVAASHFGLHAGDFLAHLGLPSLVAVVIGYLVAPRARARGRVVRPGGPIDRRALRLGSPIVAFVLVGFTVGDVLGIPAVFVVALADVILGVIVSDRRALPLPWGLVALTSGLGVCALTAAPHLGFEHLLSGTSNVDAARSFGTAIAGANVMNNLPALLVALPSMHTNVWPVLLGLNMGPALVITGSLAGLLWRDTASHVGVDVGPWQFTGVGLGVGIPAMIGAFAVLLLILDASR
jgi:arsenical pump membrane protein